MNLPRLIRGSLWAFGQRRADQVRLDRVEITGADLDEMQVEATVRLAPEPETVVLNIESAGARSPEGEAS